MKTDVYVCNVDPTDQTTHNTGEDSEPLDLPGWDDQTPTHNTGNGDRGKDGGGIDEEPLDAPAMDWGTD